MHRSPISRRRAEPSRSTCCAEISQALERVFLYQLRSPNDRPCKHNSAPAGSPNDSQDCPTPFRTSRCQQMVFGWRCSPFRSLFCRFHRHGRCFSPLLRGTLSPLSEAYRTSCSAASHVELNGVCVCNPRLPVPRDNGPYRRCTNKNILGILSR